MELKWYSPIVLLVGAILSFADPITDILTLVEFIRAGHKTWFGVGLAFVILPCFVFPIVYGSMRENIMSRYSDTRKCTQTILCGFHPFSAALARLQGFVYCLMKWWRGDELDSADEEVDDLLWHIYNAVIIESVLESAPQFIIQLYAVNVQEKPVEVIQIISLPISFVCLAWAFTTADELVHVDTLRLLDIRKNKHKLALFVTHIFLLGSRLFAVCYFTVGYKWWLIGVLLFHTFAIVTADIIWTCLKGECECSIVNGLTYLLSFFYVHWLRDDFSQHYASHESSSVNKKAALKRMQLLSNVLFVSENVSMILLFYFSPQHSNTWYSLPVTVCVCLFSVVGSVTRVIHFRVLLKESRIDPGNS